MSEKLILIKNIEKLFGTLIAVTSDISSNVNRSETTEGLGIIVSSLKKREEIMQQINVMQARLKNAAEDQMDAQEYEKHHWLCQEMAKKLQTIDQANTMALNQTLNKFADNIRSTKQSIKTIQAYNMQSAR